jgi:hypothetical protein
LIAPKCICISKFFVVTASGGAGVTFLKVRFVLYTYLP